LFTVTHRRCIIASHFTILIGKYAAVSMQPTLLQCRLYIQHVCGHKQGRKAQLKSFVFPEHNAWRITTNIRHNHTIQELVQ
jgi:hypothetical protein